MSEILINLEKLKRRQVKVCPVVLRRDSSAIGDIVKALVFEHPLAGIQIVKGTLEQGEGVVDAAIRELREESGISEVNKASYLGSWQGSDINAHDWHFVFCEVDSAQLADQWRFYTEDGGGLDFSFFWFPLQDAERLASQQTAFPTHHLYADALVAIRTLAQYHESLRAFR